MQDLIREAQKNLYMEPWLSDREIASLWNGVSRFIEGKMNQQKGVHMAGLGTFTFSQKKLDVGNNKFILLQRPVFLLSEKFAQTHGLHYTKHHTTGEIPVVQLNFAEISHHSFFDRQTVEVCVNNMLGAIARLVATRKRVEVVFNRVGSLHIAGNKVKVRFYKHFVQRLEESRKMLRSGSSQSQRPRRPHTAGPVMFRGSSHESRPGDSTSHSSERHRALQRPQTASSVRSRPQTASSVGSRPQTASSVGSRPQTASSVGSRPQTASSVGSRPQMVSTAPSRPKTASPLLSRPKTTSPVSSDLEAASSDRNRSQTPSDVGNSSPTTSPVLNRPQTANSGLTKPLITSSGLKRPQTANSTLSRPQTVSPVVPQSSTTSRPHTTDCVMPHRRTSPSLMLNQKCSASDTHITLLERGASGSPKGIRETEILVVEHGNKGDSIEKDNKALSKPQPNEEQESKAEEKQKVAEERQKTSSPISSGSNAKMEAKHSCEPIFPKKKLTEEQRQRAKQLYKEQLATAEYRMRRAILQRLYDQQEEEEMLKRNKQQLMADRSNHFMRRYLTRRNLEQSWAKAVEQKKRRESEERKRDRSASQEQLDNPPRCGPAVHTCGRKGSCISSCSPKP